MSVWWAVEVTPLLVKELLYTLGSNRNQYYVLVFNLCHFLLVIFLPEKCPFHKTVFRISK